MAAVGRVASAFFWWVPSRRKDATAAEEGMQVARFLVYDAISGRLLGDVLEGHAHSDIDGLLTLLARRTS
jgi:hypothetical protein